VRRVFFVALAVFAFDWALKWLFLWNFEFYQPFFESEYINLVLVKNTGVAFSMFAFLGEWLKFVQLFLLLGVVFYLAKEREIVAKNGAAVGLVLGGGVANLADRFVHGFVVDYVSWHKWFEFAIFNAADVCIDIGVAWIVWKMLKKGEK